MSNEINGRKNELNEAELENVSGGSFASEMAKMLCEGCEIRYTLCEGSEEALSERIGRMGYAPAPHDCPYYKMAMEKAGKS